MTTHPKIFGKFFRQIQTETLPDNGRLRLGVGWDRKQAVDQGGLRLSRLLQKFSDLEFVEATVPRRLPFVPHRQAPGLGVEDEPPHILIGRPRPASYGKIDD